MRSLGTRLLTLPRREQRLIQLRPHQHDRHQVLSGAAAPPLRMYWLVALPLLDGPDRTWSTLQQISTYNAPLSTNHRFSIPELRVGTLDTLMVLSDDLVKVNALLESVVNKIRRQVRAFHPHPHPTLLIMLHASWAKMHTQGCVRGRSLRITTEACCLRCLLSSVLASAAARQNENRTHAHNLSHPRCIPHIDL